MWINDGDAYFPSEATAEAATAGPLRTAGWGWGAAFIDHDNSGLLSVAIENGFFAAAEPLRFYTRTSADASDLSFVDSAVSLGRLRLWCLSTNLVLGPSMCGG